MKLDKAIEILAAYPDLDTPTHPEDLHAAIKLGLEALKATQLLQKQWPHLTQLRLPGETPIVTPP